MTPFRLHFIYLILLFYAFFFLLCCSSVTGLCVVNPSRKNNNNWIIIIIIIIIIITIISFLCNSSTAMNFHKVRVSHFVRIWREILKAGHQTMSNYQSNLQPTWTWRRFQIPRRKTAATRATGTTKVTVHTTIILTANSVMSIYCITSLSTRLISIQLMTLAISWITHFWQDNKSVLRSLLCLTPRPLSHRQQLRTIYRTEKSPVPARNKITISRSFSPYLVTMPTEPSWHMLRYPVLENWPASQT